MHGHGVQETWRSHQLLQRCLACALAGSGFRASNRARTYAICRAAIMAVVRVQMHSGEFSAAGKKTCLDAGKIRCCHCAAVLETQVPQLCTGLDPGLFYILILGTYSKFAQKNNFLALGVCFPQP